MLFNSARVFAHESLAKVKYFQCNDCLLRYFTSTRIFASKIRCIMGYGQMVYKCFLKLLLWAIIVCLDLINLTVPNWQKWKRVFLAFPCHKIYRVEAVGLKSFNYTWKIMIFANMWNLGQFRKKLIFYQ